MSWYFLAKRKSFLVNFELLINYAKLPKAFLLQAEWVCFPSNSKLNLEKDIICKLYLLTLRGRTLIFCWRTHWWHFRRIIQKKAMKRVSRKLIYNSYMANLNPQISLVNLNNHNDNGTHCSKLSKHKTNTFDWM